MHAPALLITARLGAKDGSNTYQTMGSPESMIGDERIWILCANSIYDLD